MKRVAAGTHLPTPWLFETAERQDDKNDYCLGCSSPPVQATGTRFLLLSGLGRALKRTVVRARPNEHSHRTGSPSDAD